MQHPGAATAILLTIAALTAPAQAWLGMGHDLAARTAVEALPENFPAFFRAGVEQIAHASLDPDLFTRPLGGKQVHATEAPEHYYDLELFMPGNLPETRYEFLDRLSDRKLAPAKVGLLPYALAEWTQRLTVALAEHRRWPDDKNIQTKCLVYAGLLAHYAADATQPLHTTIHYDGRAGADGKSPRSGIHLKTDALMGKLSVAPAAAAKGLQPVPLDKLLGGIVEQITRSHALVDRVYEMEARLPAYEGHLDEDSDVGRFTTERLRAAAEFTASLYLTAWRDSAAVKIPAWHQRPPESTARPAQTQAAGR